MVTTAIQLAKAAYDLWAGSPIRTEEERTAALQKYSDACKAAAKNLIAALDAEKVENSAKAWQTAMEAETKAIQARNDALQQGLDIELQSLEIKAKMAGNQHDLDQLRLERQNIDKTITPEQYQVASAEIARQRDTETRKLATDQAAARAQTAQDAALDAGNDADTTRLQYDNMRQAPVMSLSGLRDLERDIANKEQMIARRNDEISALLGGKDIVPAKSHEQLSAINTDAAAKYTTRGKAAPKKYDDMREWASKGREAEHQKLNALEEKLAKNNTALTDMNIVPGANGEGIQKYQERLKALEEKLPKLEDTARKKNMEADAAKRNQDDVRDLNLQEEQKSDMATDNAQRSAEVDAQNVQLQKDAAAAKTAIEESTKIVAEGLKAFNDEMEKLLAKTDADSRGGYVPGSPSAHTREAVGNAINHGVMDDSQYRALGNAYSELQDKPIKTQTDKRLMTIAEKLADQYKKTQPGQKANEDELADHAARLSKLEGGDVNDRTMAAERTGSIRSRAPA